MVRNPEDPARQRGRSADAVGLFEDEGRLAGIRRRDRCEHRSTAAADDDEIGALVPVLAHAPYPFSMKSSRLRWKLITAISCRGLRSEEHTSELQSLMRISYAVFCLKK